MKPGPSRGASEKPASAKEATSKGRAPKPPAMAVRAEGQLEKVYGKHSVRAVLIARPGDVERVVIAGREDYHADVIELAQRRNVPVFLLPWPEFNAAGKFAEDEKHQGIFAFTKPRKLLTEKDFGRLANARCVLLLDQVSNPQNLATIIRSAAFFRADGVIYMRHRAATPTPEVVRFSVGGAELVDLFCVTNLAQAIDDLRDLGFAVLGLDERGERTLAEVDAVSKAAFVIGAEGEGLRPKTREHCSELVRIPGGRKGLESLNAAVAATIALYEAKRLIEH